MTGGSGPWFLELSRDLRVPRERVFAALTDPAELGRWWGPAGFTTPEIELDLRVGGRYRLGMQPPGAELFHLTGVYLEIDPPTRLAYTFLWEEPDPDDQETVVRLTLETVADGTRLSLWHGEFAAERRLDLHKSGWTDALLRLTELLGSEA